MHTLTRRIDIYQRYLTRTIAILAGLCVLSIFFYLVFLMLALGHTTTRTSAQTQVDKLTVEVSTLETQYLQEMKLITPERAVELGYVTPSTVTPVFAQQDSGHPLSLQYR